MSELRVSVAQDVQSRERTEQALRREASRCEELRSEVRNVREELQRAETKCVRAEHRARECEEGQRRALENAKESEEKSLKSQERAEDAERKTRSAEAEKKLWERRALDAEERLRSGRGDSSLSSTDEALRVRAAQAEERAAREGERAKQLERESERLGRLLAEAKSEMAKQREMWGKEESAMKGLQRALEARLEDERRARVTAEQEARVAEERLKNKEEEWERQVQELKQRIEGVQSAPPSESQARNQEDDHMDVEDNSAALGGIASQMASRLEATTRQLYHYKAENSKLNESLGEIVREIESKAPVIQNMRREWEEAVRSRERMSLQLKKTLESHAQMETAVLEMKTRETVLQQHIEDLGTQISVLLQKQVQHRAEQGDADAAVVTFKDIDDLRRQNSLLVLQLREAKTQSKVYAERKAAEVMDQCHKELEALREARKQQEELVERTIRQKEVYKNLLARLAEKGAGLDVSAPKATLDISASDTISRADYQRERASWEEKLVALESQVVSARADIDRGKAELEWAETRLSQFERDRAAWLSERERLEKNLIQTTDRLARTEDRLLVEQKRGEEAREAREEMRQRLAALSKESDKNWADAEAARALLKEGETERATLRKAVERLSVSFGAAEEARKMSELEVLRCREEIERARADAAEWKDLERVARERAAQEVERERERAKEARVIVKEVSVPAAAAPAKELQPFGGDALRARVSELESELLAEKEALQQWRDVARAGEEAAEAARREVAASERKWSATVAEAEARAREWEQEGIRARNEAEEMRGAARQSARVAREAREEARNAQQKEERLLQSVEDAQKRVEEHIKQHEEDILKIGQLVTQLRELRDQNRDLEVRCTRAESRVQGMDTIRRQIETEFKEEIEQAQRKAQDAEERLVALKATCEALQKALNTEIPSSEVVPHMRREHEVLEARCEVLEMQVARLTERLHNARREEEERLKAQASVVERSDAFVRLARDEHDALLRRASEAEMARESRELMRQQLEGAMREAELLRVRAVEAERSRGPSADRVRELQEELAVTQQRADQRQNEVEQLKARVTQLTEKYSSVDPAMVDQARAEAVEQKQKLQDLIRKFKSLKTDYEKSKSEAASLSAELEQAKRQASEAEELKETISLLRTQLQVLEKKSEESFLQQQQLLHQLHDAQQQQQDAPASGSLQENFDLLKVEYERLKEDLKGKVLAVRKLTKFAREAKAKFSELGVDFRGGVGDAEAATPTSTTTTTTATAQTLTPVTTTEAASVVAASVTEAVEPPTKKTARETPSAEAKQDNVGDTEVSEDPVEQERRQAKATVAELRKKAMESAAASNVEFVPTSETVTPVVPAPVPAPVAAPTATPTTRVKALKGARAAMVAAAAPPPTSEQQQQQTPVTPPAAPSAPVASTTPSGSGDVEQKRSERGKRFASKSVAVVEKQNTTGHEDVAGTASRTHPAARVPKRAPTEEPVQPVTDETKRSKTSDKAE